MVLDFRNDILVAFSAVYYTVASVSKGQTSMKGNVQEMVKIR